MRLIPALFRGLGTAVAFWLAAAPPVSGQTVINSLPYTISAAGSYVLGGNLSFGNTNGTSAITVASSNVILDLSGFYISGPPFPVSNATAILVGNVTNVTVRNGTLANTGYGIRIAGGNGTSINHLFENLNITRCFFDGIRFGAGTSAGTVVRGNVITQIGQNPNFDFGGVDARAIAGGGGARIEDNVVDTVVAFSGGISYGIRAAPGDLCIGNTVSNCQTGIQALGSAKYLDNLTFGCATPFSGGTNATGNN